MVCLPSYGRFHFVSKYCHCRWSYDEQVRALGTFHTQEGTLRADIVSEGNGHL